MSPINSRFNFAEKIIFVIDTATNSILTRFNSSTDKKTNLFNVMKHAIEIFMHNKQMLNQKHEFAFITLDSLQAYWYCNFTNNLQYLYKQLESIPETASNEKYFNFKQVFELIYEKIEKCFLQDGVIHLILLYTRSNTIPTFNTIETHICEMLQNPNIFLDILYIHDSLSTENKCADYFAELSQAYIKTVSYTMKVTRTSIEIHNYMSRLLAHPIQRDL